MHQNLYILSKPIQSGKTSALQAWIATQQKVGGFVCPDKDGMRQLMDLATGATYALQLPEHAAGTRIGRFNFSNDAIEKGRQILKDVLNAPFDWVVIDEIGRLEMDQSDGWEPALGKLLRHIKENGGPKLLLVVRNYLLDKTIHHYGLEQARIIPRLDAIHASINGLVLCGGKSQRMGSDKAFIAYHVQPQYLQVKQILAQFCDTVTISHHGHQAFIDENIVMDDAAFANAGPLTGILSFISKNSDKPLLLAACDYPYLKRADMLQLVSEAGADAKAICFHNENKQIEPLIAYLHPNCFDDLLSYYAEGGRSIKYFLEHIGATTLKPENPYLLQSFDTPEASATFDLKKYHNE